MQSAHSILKENIICLTRSTKLKLSPSRWLEVLENALSSPVQVIKEVKPKRTVRTFLAPWGEICLQDLKCGIKRQMLSPFRFSRGKRAWNHSLSLIQNNFPITEPLLYLELKNGPFVKRTVTITRWIESTNLGKTAKERHLISEDFLLGLLKESTELVARLHSSDFVHTDLKWSNFLWVPSEQSRIILTDLDHIEKSGTGEKQGKDLARFILSALEYQMGWEVAESLINCYFDSRKVRPAGLEKSLAKRIERKKNKYEKRCPTKVEEQ
jgi:tRNA A-37 threonylcarbamoyl transferase component Bud32